jgi:hypothetical protein
LSDSFEWRLSPLRPAVLQDAYPLLIPALSVDPDSVDNRAMRHAVYASSFDPITGV